MQKIWSDYFSARRGEKSDEEKRKGKRGRGGRGRRLRCPVPLQTHAERALAARSPRWIGPLEHDGCLFFLAFPRFSSPFSSFLSGPVALCLSPLGKGRGAVRGCAPSGCVGLRLDRRDGAAFFFCLGWRAGLVPCGLCETPLFLLFRSFAPCLCSLFYCPWLRRRRSCMC